MMRARFEPRAEGAPETEKVERMLAEEFPPAQAGNGGAEGILQAFTGSRNTRQGPAPDAGEMDAMMRVIRHYMGAGRSIPVLVPSGPKKNGLGAGVDLAELSALRMLGSLQASVLPLYEPGFEFVFRMEDATGHWLEGTAPEMTATMDGYIGGLERMIRVLGYSGFISLTRETSIVSSDAFSAEAAEMLPLFLKAVLTGDSSGLESVGWRGGVSRESVEYLLGRYERLYPDESGIFRSHMAARYLAAAMGRIRLRATGARENWDGGRLEISFQPRMPGVRKGFHGTRVNYRTVPVKHGKLHIPFWRAKGVVKRKGGSVRYGLCHWGSDGYGPGEAILEKGPVRAEMSCDFEKGAEP
jgi:hypothetical protein